MPNKSLEKFGEYQLLTKIATGGMAEIFLAKHSNSPANSMPIAIKKVLKQYNSNPHFVSMFLTEARIICNITHENIVRIYDFGKEEGQYFIAMEYVFGQNLGVLLNKLAQNDEKLPTDIILEISMAVLNGLDHAHNTKDKKGHFLNVVHLDMNPNNILISYSGKVKIVDFGIAHATYSGKNKNLNSIQGTYGYLSPEQCREEPTDRRSDIFSFGIILYEMLTNKPLFKHLPSDVAILNQILNEPIPPISEVNPEISEDLAKIVMKALEKDKNKRYLTAKEMIEDLRKVHASLEFNVSSKTLPKILKRHFASHFIKMNRIIEKAQTKYLMDEIFNDIGKIEEINLHEKMRIEPQKIEKKPKNNKKLIFILSFITAIILIGAFFLANHHSTKKIVSVSIFSSPPGAEIYINGEDQEKQTPAVIKLKANIPYIIEFKKGNYFGGKNFIPTEKHSELNIKLQKKLEK